MPRVPSIKYDKNGKRIKRPPVTVKEKRFVAEYIKTGSATEAALRAYDTDDYSTAGAIGSKALERIDMKAVMEKHGITDDYLAKKMKEGINSKDEKGNKDYRTRYLYIKTALKLRGHDAESSSTVNIQNNVIRLPEKKPLEELKEVEPTKELDE